jgi:CheY-like chemotaxis protein
MRDHEIYGAAPSPARLPLRPTPAACSLRGMLPAILVVDDEPVVCQVTCRMLQEAGYACEGVYSARAALGFLGPSRPYNLFVLDVRLPDMSGLTLAYLIAAQYPACPFLFISGFPQSNDERLPTSPWAFLAKPFSSEQLLTAVKQLLASEPTAPPAV